MTLLEGNVKCEVVSLHRKRCALKYWEIKMQHGIVKGIIILFEQGNQPQS